MADAASPPAFCTDEDLFIAAPGDFCQLVPMSQSIASCRDGLFPADPNGSWGLQSATVGFEGRGLAPGHVVQLRGPASVFRAAEVLAVASVAGSVVTLRRAGLPAGVGNPPGPLAGLTAVELEVGTLRPQIERASYELARAFGLDPDAPTDLVDPRELREACVALVLGRQYREMARHAGKLDDFTEKASSHQADYARILQRTQLHTRSGPDALGRGLRVSR